MKRLIFALSLLMASCMLPAAQAEPKPIAWHWKDSFSPQQQRNYQGWLTDVYDALGRVTGPLPFTVHIELFSARNFSSEDMGEPVPWARTWRNPERQAVQLYLDTRYSLSEFKRDWTAPHELSHLLLPYLGEKDSWLAEGFASYMQFIVMEEMGVIDGYIRQQRLVSRIQKAEAAYNKQLLGSISASHASLSLAERLRLSGQLGDSPTMYWGGAVFFLQLDAKLNQRGGLTAVLKRYLKCCRLPQQDTGALLKTLDKLSFSDLFTTTYQAFHTQSQFPDYRRYIESATTWSR
ncbi:hypothetical protein [Bacterioplanoides sp.]|uniref:hypothetical protein n=1 Tax=Bacterioplanoides sp. TaxID=2066072 RepID=UPI003B595B6E